MMEILICALKWIVAGLAMPVGLVVVMVAFGWTLNFTIDTVAKLTVKSIGEASSLLVSKAALLVLVVAVLSFAIFLSAKAIMPKFGCDDCLPESWQEQCTISDRDRMEQADRKKAGELTAEIRAMCDRWSWTDCPVPKE